MIGPSSLDLLLTLPSVAPNSARRIHRKSGMGLEEMMLYPQGNLRRVHFSYSTGVSSEFLW